MGEIVKKQRKKAKKDKILSKIGFAVKIEIKENARKQKDSKNIFLKILQKAPCGFCFLGYIFTCRW